MSEGDGQQFTYTPTQQAPAQQTPVTAAVQPPQPPAAAQPQPPTPQAQPPVQPPTPKQPQQPATTPQPAPQQSSEPDAEDSSDDIRWQASEFVDHEKGGNWFFLLILATFAVGAITYLLSRSIFSTAVVFVAALAFALTAKQKPRTMQYSLRSTGISVGGRQYRYEDFKSFSVAREGALWSIVLRPIKRLMPNLTIYFDPNDGERIFDVLAEQMPHEEHQPDPIDRFMSRIRF